MQIATGFACGLNALRVSAVVPQHGTKADMIRRVSPDEESGAHGAPDSVLHHKKHLLIPRMN